MHGHPHAHPHGGGGAPKLSQIITKGNAIHFLYLAATTIGYFSLFSFQSFIGTFIIYLLYSIICAFICATVITPAVLVRPVSFLSRYMTLSAIAFVICSFFIDWKGRAILSRDIFPQRIVHLDMKGAPPTVKYLESVFPVFASLGATGILIEWDNMFPYEDTEKFPFSAVRANDAYTKEEVTKIIASAKSNGLKVYPLIQSFGQMNFLLKNEKFASYRALQNKYGTLHPTNPASRELAIALIDQVLSLHPKVDMLHLGGNQVNLECSECGSKKPEDIYLDYMGPLFNHLKDRKLKTLIWDDMLRSWPEEKLQELNPYCEVVVWRQGSAESRNDALNKYMGVFKTMWAGTPFRGADEKSHFPLIRDYLEYATAAVQLGRAAKLDNQLPPFSGVIVIGLSRVPDAEGAISEILPASIPSLAFSLSMLKAGQLTDRGEAKLLQQLGLQGLPVGSKMEKLSTEAVSSLPTFPGGEAFKMAAALELGKFKANPPSKDRIRSAIEGILTPKALSEIEDKISKSE